MAMYSTNQVRNLYVVNAVGDPMAENAVVGTMQIKKTDEGEVYGLYKGAGGITRTDLIKVSSIRQAKTNSYDELKRPLQKWEVSLAQDVNGGAPIAKQEYLLRVIIKEYGSMSPESYLTKYGQVYVTPGMAASDFYKKMVQSLNDAFKAYDIQYFKFSLDDNSSATKIIIEEQAQPWVLGLKSSDPIYADFVTDMVTTNDGEHMQWGVTKRVAPTSFVKNGHQIADLEYFCMGERGDVYRMVGFPYVRHTDYLVDPSKEYNVLNLHFYYTDEGVFCQASEKEMQLVFPADGDTPATKIALANSFVTAFNAATGATTANPLTAPAAKEVLKAAPKSSKTQETLPASEDK